MPVSLRPSVQAVWWRFSARFEGVVDHLYRDIKNLVTIGVGNLVDPIERALDLPFLWRLSGAPASRAEIAAEWEQIKTLPDLGRLGHPEAAKHCKLFLPPEALRRLVQKKLEKNTETLAGRWPAFPEWPAPAQLAIESWAWAGGPGRTDFPKMSAALDRGDFATAALEVKLREEDNAGVVPRNAANKALLLTAAEASDPDTLLLPWEAPEHHPELPEPDRAAVEALVAQTLWLSSWASIQADRSARDRAEAEAAS